MHFLALLILALVGTVSVVEGIRCYQCGEFVITSVTPCQNLTSAALKECPAQSTHCAKYTGPAITVYGCETNCVDKVQNSFEIHCCGEDKCNAGIRTVSSEMWLLMSSLLLLSLPAIL